MKSADSDTYSNATHFVGHRAGTNKPKSERLDLGSAYYVAMLLFVVVVGGVAVVVAAVAAVVVAVAVAVVVVFFTEC